MSYHNLALARHILDEINFILQHTKDRTKEIVIDDAVLSRALIRSLEVIGEASRKMDNDFKAAHPEIEWRKMSGTRDKLIHDYLGVDYEIVWEIIQEKLPILRERIEKLLLTG
jgi:uncharacterized protein with HEPN domain